MLKAITASLLMEQVLAPNWKFKTKVSEEDKAKPGEIKNKGLKEPITQRVKDIVEEDITDLKAAIFQDTTMLKAMPDVSIDPEVINKVLIPKVIRTKYPDLTNEQVEEVRQHVVVDSVIKNGTIKEVSDKRFIRMAGSFVDIDDIHIDLIDRVNPFQKAFEVLSKSVSAKVLKVIQETIEATRIKWTLKKLDFWPKIQNCKTFNRQPDINSIREEEKRMAECIIYLKDEGVKRHQIMKDKESILKEIFENDPFGLLTVKPKKSAVRTSDERLAASFDQINDFIKKMDESQPDPTNISEYKLYSTLKGLGENEEKTIALESQDIHGLLNTDKKEINSLDDILGDDSLNILEMIPIIPLSNIHQRFERAKADFIGKRFKCEDFHKYEQQFKDVQDDLALGKRKLID